jgi:hypothetical protein
MGIPDRTSVGPSRLVPYRRDESPPERHERRKREAMASEESMRHWLFVAGISIAIKNDGHHWQMTCDGMVFEWWPSSAKLVVCKRWEHGFHCHDWEQVARIVERTLRRAKAGPYKR